MARNGEELNEQMSRYVELYANPGNKETFQQQERSLLEAGYSPATVKTQKNRIVKHPLVVDAVNTLYAKYRVQVVPVIQTDGDADMAALESLLVGAIDFNILNLYEKVEWVEKGLNGQDVMRRELQVRDLWEAGIDGRLLQEFIITRTQKGQTITAKGINKIQAGQLLARLRGRLTDETAQKTVSLTLNLGQGTQKKIKIINPKNSPEELELHVSP